MPTGGGYATTSTAAERLRNAVKVSRNGGLAVNAEEAKPSFCSGATYLLFLKVVEKLWQEGILDLTPEQRGQLLIGENQPDGQGIWGRWNANGPGTGRLFYELGLGRNFVEFSEAKRGDFMKIFWTNAVGKKEHGHSVVFLGTEFIDGVEHVCFWSSNIPEGYGAKSVPRSKIIHAIFSRLENPQHLNRVGQLPDGDNYLAGLLTKESSFAEAKRMVGIP